jgi:hypothetical protein
MKKIILFAVLVLYFLNLIPAMTITIGIPDKYQEVSAGETIYFQTEVKWPENDMRKDLRIEYFIKDKDGGEVAYLKVLKAIETQATFMDSITIPESTPSGLYKIYAEIGDYTQMSEEVAASFKVTGKKEDTFMIYLYIILAVVILIAILIAIQFFIIVKKNK